MVFEIVLRLRRLLFVFLERWAIIFLLVASVFLYSFVAIVRHNHFGSFGFDQRHKICGPIFTPCSFGRALQQKRLQVPNLPAARPDTVGGRQGSKLKANLSFIINHLSLAIISFGLLSYMFFLNKHYGDPFLFFHVQPSFGAQRSGGEVILLPQVIWRYLKIFVTADLTFEYAIAVLEFLSLAFACLILIFAFFKKMRLSYQVFAWLSLLAPTLTGTLSSLPRYILTIFPIFISLGLIESKKVKLFLLFTFYFLLFFLTSFFTRGYFVA